MIKATILKDSIHNGNRITTFELEYPRFIHAEIMTHRLFSRNAASSRAIPVKTTAKQIKESPEQPVIWGKNISGMQSSGELTGIKLHLAKFAWNTAAYIAATSSEILSKLGVHKQWANRVSEYAQTYKVVITATEWDNFFHLRRHKDAQPEIKELADKMYESLNASIPFELKKDEWHLPYISTARNDNGSIIYFTEEGALTLEEAKQISASSCAQVSYRRLDTSLEKAKKIFDMLIKAEVIHASPFEHLATPVIKPYNRMMEMSDWQEGVTHVDKNSDFWSGNLKNWVQYRHLIPNNTCTDYNK